MSVDIPQEFYKKLEELEELEGKSETARKAYESLASEVQNKCRDVFEAATYLGEKLGSVGMMSSTTKEFVVQNIQAPQQLVYAFLSSLSSSEEEKGRFTKAFEEGRASSRSRGIFIIEEEGEIKTLRVNE